MSREAFEAALNALPAQKRWATPKLLAWEAWQAARAAALEEAAEACESEAELWQEGVEARLCAARIRALKEQV